jgi:hypothetical protein
MTRRASRLLLALGALGCTQDPSVPKFGNLPVTISFQLSTLSLKAGDPDTIRVTVTNNLDQNVRLTFGSQCQVFVTVRNSAGDIVTPRDGRPECLPIASALTLVARGTREYLTIWTGGYKFLPPDTQEKVPPGAYFVTAELIASDYSVIAPPFKVDIVP